MRPEGTLASVTSMHDDSMLNLRSSFLSGGNFYLVLPANQCLPIYVCTLGVSGPQIEGSL